MCCAQTSANINNVNPTEHYSHGGRTCTNLRTSTQSIFQQVFLRCLAFVYPCASPINPHMQQKENRLETFDSRWNPDYLKATPEEIAEAGFYFLGEKDRTKCWYCNGGLQNWEPDDDPLYEHAKWFPGCEFILQTYGPEFIRDIREKFPNISRPQIDNEVNYKQGMKTLEQLNNLSETWCGEIHQMGFTAENIAMVVISRLRQSNFQYSHVEDLIADILSSQESGNSEAMWIIERITAAGIPLKSRVQTSPTTDDYNNQHDCGVLKGICAGCKATSANMICMPCGHLSNCGECRTEKCRRCGCDVDNYINIYLS